MCHIFYRTLQPLSVADKHKFKIGEPGFAVAAAERGKRVIVSLIATLKLVIMILHEWELFYLFVFD